MKKFLRYSWLMVLPMVAAAAIVWKSSAASIGECPPVLPEDRTVLLCDDADWSSFWSCSGGVKIFMHCPDGLYYNPTLEVCDWPREVDRTDCTKALPKYTCAKTITYEEGLFAFFCGTCDWVANSAPTQTTTWGACYM